LESIFLHHLQSFASFEDIPGDNPVRVYLAGLGMSAFGSFARINPNTDLSGNRSIYFDLPGFGFSDRPFEFSYSLEDQARTVAELLDRLGISHVFLIGHSLGGSVAITLAILRPDLISRLIVAEGNLDPGGGTFSKGIAAQSEEEFTRTGFANLLHGIKTKAENGDKSMTAFACMLQTAAPYAVYRSALALTKGIKSTMRTSYYELTIPRAYICGEQSLPDAPDSRELTKHGIKVLVVPHAGHFMMFENPNGFSQVLREALIQS